MTSWLCDIITAGFCLLLSALNRCLYPRNGLRSLGLTRHVPMQGVFWDPSPLE